jgi:hypothetical protein
LSGESFEAFGVRYYSDALKDPINVNDIDILVSEYSRLLSRQVVLDWSKYRILFESKLKKTLQVLPGSSAQEKFDSLYLLLRGPFHAGNLDRNFYTPPSCMPLQSINLLMAKRMLINHQNSNRVVYDVTMVLNPLLSILPYNNDKTNAEFNSNRDGMLIGKSPFKSAFVPIERPLDIAAWDAAYKMRKSNTSSSSVSTEIDLREFYLTDLRSMLSYLANLNEPLNLFNDFVAPIYWYVTKFTLDIDELAIIHHKISSVFDLNNFCSYDK